MQASELEVKQLLSDENIIHNSDSFTPLSGGRTNRVWKISGKKDLICKLYSKSTQNPLYENVPMSEYACLKQMSGQNIAPEPRIFLTAPFGQVLVYNYLHGTIWDQDAAAVSTLLSHIHQQPAPKGLRQLAVGTEALVAQTLKILATLTTECSDRIKALQPHVECTFENPHCLVHTDVVPGNLIRTGTGLRLIDWQCPGIGDPVEDLAVFLSPAMHLIYRGQTLPDAQQADFLAAYPDINIQERCKIMMPLYHWRMIAYCAWKEARGAEGYGAAKQLEIEALKQLR